MRAAPLFAGLFVKFVVVALGILQFPEVETRDFHSSDGGGLQVVGCSRCGPAEGAMHFKANVGTIDTSATKLEAEVLHPIHE